VIGHQAVGHEPNTGPVAGFLQDFLKGSIVTRFIEEWQAGNPAVQYVKSKTSSGNSQSARHEVIYRRYVSSKSRKDSRPLFTFVFV